MTCHPLHAGNGYEYLTRQVASADTTRSAHDSLTGYYTAQGNPPGQWAGSGRADLGMDGEVTEEHMLALFGECLRPDANEHIKARQAAGDTYEQARKAARLGRRFAVYGQDVPLVAAVEAAYRDFERDHARRPSVQERRDIKMAVARTLMAAAAGPDAPPPTREEVRKYLVDELGRARQPVAGYDLVFSPVKSVSLLWALGDQRVQQTVAEVHEAAWRAALAYGEREAAFTRIGAGGVAQVATSGFVAAAFLHRDSRAGDPDLHTHVAVANRVRAADGTWRTIDGQQLFKVAVSMSELYNALVEQGLTEQLGVAFVEVAKGAGKRSVREVAGMPAEWIRGFSRRRTQVEARYERLLAEYVREHGGSPPRTVQMRLAQQATLEQRPDKQQLRSLADQVRGWVATARRLRPGAPVQEVIDGCLHPGPDVAPAAVGDLAAVAAAVVDRVSQDRSTWTVYHVRAEAQRALRPVAFDTAGERQRAVETVVEYALGRESVRLDVELDAVPVLLQRESGEGVFHRHGSELFTSEAILAAESRLVADAHSRRGPVVSDRAREAAIDRFQARRRAEGTPIELNAGQRLLVEHFVSGGQALCVAIGPPGTGKSVAMGAVREAWESATGGRVVGLAPSAAAASVLGDQLGIRANTLHSLVVAHQSGVDIDLEPGDMVLVDEAGMAGTRTLDEVRAVAAEHGAVVRLVGDHRQLTAVEAGGALRLLFGQAGGVELTEVRRFRRPEEAGAVLLVRVGDPAAIGFYAANGRLHGGIRAAVLDRLYADWNSDLGAGHTSIMISDSTEVARELSARAQTERRAAGLVEHGGVGLHDGTVAGVGDRVVTRLNRRRLALFAGREYVKNGDLWEVEARYPDGRMRVRHGRHGGRVTLPAWYVAEWVELGYAATIHRAQGLTVDIARSFLSPSATREAALVALSRGVDGNHAYLDTEQALALDEPRTLPGDLFSRYRETREAADALAAILAREGAELSATEALRDALDSPWRMDPAVPQYQHALQVHRGPQAVAEAEGWVRQAVPRRAEEILVDPAWPALYAVLNEARDAGADPVALLSARARQRELGTAESVAKVLHHRVAAAMPTVGPGGDRPALLPGWVPTPPPEPGGQADGDRAELAVWLRRRAEQIADRVRTLGDRAAEQPPAWAAGLGPVSEDPVAREQWVARAGQVAAYRERWHVPDGDAVLLPAAGRGEQGRARAWVQAYLRTSAGGSTTAGVEPVGAGLVARTARLRDRLAEVRERLVERVGFTPAENVTSGTASAHDEPENVTEADINNEEWRVDGEADAAGDTDEAYLNALADDEPPDYDIEPEL
ncbi:MobF family relaxase [Solihabitans fulvus]|nr:MobF family relaxase [Solihabitans fulvus]